jgi:hypothetical protein
MDWETVFEQAQDHDVTVEAISEALTQQRDR